MKKRVRVKPKPKRGRKIDPQQPYVGTYRLGTTNIEVFGNTRSSGGEFFCIPDSTSLPRMKIGFDCAWWQVVSTTLHEAFEYVAAQIEVRFQPCGTAMNASDTYRFHFNHEQFTRISEEVGYFLCKALPDLSNSFRKYGKRR